jgi:hypothetical protein
MTYKEHLIFVATQRDIGGCFWLPSPMFVGAREKTSIASLLKVVLKTILYIPRRLRFALSRWRASGWVDNHIQNGL